MKEKAAPRPARPRPARPARPHPAPSGPVRLCSTPPMRSDRQTGLHLLGVFCQLQGFDDLADVSGENIV